jgi:hypothetical protein
VLEKLQVLEILFLSRDSHTYKQSCTREWAIILCGFRVLASVRGKPRPCKGSELTVDGTFHGAKKLENLISRTESTSVFKSNDTSRFCITSKLIKHTHGRAQALSGLMLYLIILYKPNVFIISSALPPSRSRSYKQYPDLPYHCF